MAPKAITPHGGHGVRSRDPINCAPHRFISRPVSADGRYMANGRPRRAVRTTKQPVALALEFFSPAVVLRRSGVGHMAVA